MKNKKKPNGYWTFERILIEAKKYDIRKDFIIKSSGAYGAARRLNILKKVCSHMKDTKNVRRLNVYWTKERIVEEAKKYNTRNDFQRKSGGAYNASARRLNILDEVCSHMKEIVKPNGYWTKEKVIEKAKKYDIRKDFMIKSSRAYNAACKLNILKEVCSHMKNLQQFWTKKRIEERAKEYNTRTEFSKKASGAYAAAIKKEILDNVCSHMKPQGSHYKRALYIIKFPRIKSCYVGLTYNYKERKNRHLNQKTNPNVKKLLDAGEKYIFEEENIWYDIFEVGQREAECVKKMKLKGWNILNIAKSGVLGGKPIKWTEYTIFEEAKKYNMRTQFCSGASGAYAAAIKKGIMNKVCAHMKKTRELKGYWTKERVIEEAKKYNTRNEFRTKSNGAYDAATYRLNILDEVCSHMKPRLSKK